MPDAEERIKLYLDSLFDCAMQQKGSFDVQENKKPAVSSVVQFTKKEILKMDKTFKKEFIANGLAAHVTRRTKHKSAISFVIRYRRNGYEIFVCGTTLDAAKEKFIKATLPENIEKY